jgi:hypothetical protein
MLVRETTRKLNLVLRFAEKEQSRSWQHPVFGLCKKLMILVIEY